MGVCRELASLQSAYQTERLEGNKVRQLLAYEETRRCNLEESLDQAHKHAKDQQRDLQNKVPLLIDHNTHHLVCCVPGQTVSSCLLCLPHPADAFTHYDDQDSISTAVDDLQPPGLCFSGKLQKKRLVELSVT